MESIDVGLEIDSPQEKSICEKCIEFDIDLENSMLFVSLPNSIKIIIPITTAAKNSEYINCFYEAVANKSVKFVNKNKINLHELGWTFDPIQISMFFYWLGSSPLAANQLGDISILVFFILSDYFQLSEVKINELIDMLSTFSLNNAYLTMKPFLTRRYIPWHLFKEILKTELKTNTIKAISYNSVRKNQPAHGQNIPSNSVFGNTNPTPFSGGSNFHSSGFQKNSSIINANQNYQTLYFPNQPKPLAQHSQMVKIESFRLINLKILLDWFDEKNIKIDENFPIPCYNEVNEFIKENKAKLIPGDNTIVTILSEYSNVHRVIDARLCFEVLNNTVY